MVDRVLAPDVADQEVGCAVGTIGIGTTTPNEKLEVHGTVKVNGDAMTEKQLKIVRYWDATNSHTITIYLSAWAHSYRPAY